MKYFFLVILILPISILAQNNDECISAINITNISDYCSGDAEFSNQGATASGVEKPSCWPSGESHDVWFSFKPKDIAVFIGVTGAGQFTSATLENPSIAVYEGRCGQLKQLNDAACSSDLNGSNVVELTLDDISIGSTYYLRVDARDGNTGSFKLCMKEFTPPKNPEQDCATASLLCDKSSFYVESIVGNGITEDLSGSCIREEFASVWYKWVCDTTGTLTFDLKPNKIDDDLDFAVYRLPGGIDDCENKELVRCMASGETIGAGTSTNDPCFGATGLSEKSTDTNEDPGCEGGSDNYVAALDMVKGEAYVLIVNNYSQSGSGFSIDFGGTGTFLGPEADFEVEGLTEFECDKTIEFTNLSTSSTDPIVSYNWNFGDGSNPTSGTGGNAKKTVYSSFGNKIAALTVETKRGCQITKVKEFFVEPCCDDFDSVIASANPKGVTCFGYTDGSAVLSAKGGRPGYTFATSTTNSINYKDLSQNPSFQNFGKGEYYGFSFDEKGCADTIKFTIDEPLPIVVDLGDDLLADLGDEIAINADYSPKKNKDVLSWTPESFFECQDCLQQTVPARDNATITLTVTDEKGCVGSDSLNLKVRKIRDLGAPNAFSPFKKDRINDFFNIFTNKGVDSLEQLLVYDRWGNKMYEGRPKRNSLNDGWNGTSNGGKQVEKGVYYWKARVRYLDGVLIVYSGDITVVD